MVDHVSKEEVLWMWELRYGELSPQRREEFLARNEVATIATYGRAWVSWAIAGNRSLLDVLDALENSPSPPERERRPPRRRRRSGSLNPPEGSRRVGYPEPPLDSDLHKRIGPTQNYDDET